MAKDEVHEAGERAFEQAAQQGQQEASPAADTGLSYEEIKGRVRDQEDQIDRSIRRTENESTDT